MNNDNDKERDVGGSKLFYISHHISYIQRLIFYLASGL